VRVWAVLLLLTLFLVPNVECLATCPHPCCHTCGHGQSLFTATPTPPPVPLPEWRATAPIPSAASPLSQKPVLFSVPEIDGPPPPCDLSSLAVLRI
jgi:hypothetical protein